MVRRAWCLSLTFSPLYHRVLSMPLLPRLEGSHLSQVPGLNVFPLFDFSRTLHRFKSAAILFIYILPGSGL